MAIEKIYLDRRFTVNGKKSHIHLDNFVELGVFPAGGLPCQIIIKNSNNYWDYDWGYFDDLMTVNNALTYDNADCPNLLQWGGDLVKNTTVNGLLTYDVIFTDLNRFSLSAQSTVQVVAGGNLALDSSAIAALIGRTELHIRTPNSLTNTVNQGALLQLLDNTANIGQAEYTPFAFPLVDGTVDQVLQTDGAGTVSWADPSSSSVSQDNIYTTNGVLQFDRIVDGDTLNNYSLEFINMGPSSWQGIAELNLDFQSLIVNLPSGTSAGRVLQLQDPITNLVEYSPYELPITTATVGDVLVATSPTELSFQAQEKSLSIQLASGDVELSTINGTNAGITKIPITPQLNGYILKSMSATVITTGGSPSAVGFRVDHFGVGTGLINSSIGTTPLNFTPSAFPVLTTNDTIDFAFSSGSGTDLFGLVLVFDFATT